MPNTINSFFRAGFKRTGWLAAAAIDEEGENKNLHDCEELKQKTDFNMSRVKCFEREKNQTDLPQGTRGKKPSQDLDARTPFFPLKKFQQRRKTSPIT